MEKESKLEQTESYISGLIQSYPQDLQESIKEWMQHRFSNFDLPNLFPEIRSHNLALRLHGLIGVRNTLEQEENPPIQMVVNNEIVPHLINFIKLQDQPFFQSEAACCLAIIAKGTSEQKESVVQHNAIKLFYGLLDSQFPQIVKQGIRSLFFLSGVTIYRDLILEIGGMKKLLHLVQATEENPEDDPRVWTILNLCLGIPRPNIELTGAAGSFLCSVLSKMGKLHLRTVWALEALSEGTRENREVIPSEALPEILIEMKKHEKDPPPYLLFFRNILANTESQANILMNLPDFIPTLFEFLHQTKDTEVRKKIYDVFAEITRSPQRKDLLLANPEWIENLRTDVFEHSREKCCLQGIMIFVNAAQDCTPECAMILFKNGVLKFFISLLRNKKIIKDQLLTIALFDGVFRILRKAPNGKESPFFTFIQNDPEFYYLQWHQRKEICRKTRKFLKDFCMEKETIKYKECSQKSFTGDELPKFLAAMDSDDESQQINGVVGIRKLLWDFEVLVDSPRVAQALLYLAKTGDYILQLEASRTLRYLTTESSNQNQAIGEMGGGVSGLLSLLKSPHEAIAIEAIWTLGNIALQGQKPRDQIFQQNGAKTIVKVLENNGSKTLLGHGFWALYNLLKKKPRPEFKFVKDVLPFVIHVLQAENEEDILINAAWTLSCLAKYREDDQNVIPKKAIPHIQKYLETNSNSLCLAILETLGNIAAGSFDDAIKLRKVSYLSSDIYRLLEHQNAEIRSKASWVRSKF